MEDFSGMFRHFFFRVGRRQLRMCANLGASEKHQVESGFFWQVREEGSFVALELIEAHEGERQIVEGHTLA